jgi:exonuclease SbcC
MAGRDGAKVELEVFAIGTMFDLVIDAANLRMRPMTAGRYTLAREHETKGGGRRGLGLCIEDTYTGRSRPTSTLSGGETFIAALALALGLSDVVESSRGNIRLDTIFIDEGFGSLDADNDAGTLDRVLSTLQNLAGQKRAVGVISHVPLVQQAIPNGFLVSQSAKGSTIEERTSY